MSKIDEFAESEDIAIIGMAGRFPGAKNVQQFWQNLSEGREAITFFSEEDLRNSGVDETLLRNPDYVKAFGLLKDIEQFDADFFGILPRDAELMDPQHRLFLECAWEALENAGYDAEAYQGRIGVYAGTSMSLYLLRNLSTHHELLKSPGLFQLLLNNDKDHLTTRVSYKLNLRGPSINFNTTCSTSLVAVHGACQSLLGGECDIALAGGVSIKVPQKTGYIYQDGGIASPDGHCRAFDARAQGTVAGNGVGIVVLKRLPDAIASGDHVYALIKGSAVNNDGSLKVGYTAPSIGGQSAVIAEALAVARVAPETITYIEAHGTATSLGDPIEIAALTQAFGNRTKKSGSAGVSPAPTSLGKEGFCAIGSAKTNVGHLDAAAGIAGLLKTVLALEHKLLPPSLHYERPNPQIDFQHSPFYVNTVATVWQTGATPRRAGLSSFGIGGTNAHMILEEAPEIEAFRSNRPWQLLILSARSANALRVMNQNLATHLEQHSELKLADVAHTLQVGRKKFEYRQALVCSNLDDAIDKLKAPNSKHMMTGQSRGHTQHVVFLFPGQGTQYVNMARELYQIEPVFRETVDYCAALLSHIQGVNLLDVLYPDNTSVEDATEQLTRTALAQPALFIVEYALAKMWMKWGVQPQAMIGHSIGEYVAACLAGVFALEDALMLVATRGQLMQKLPEGSMLSVPLTEQELQPLLNQQLSLAAINGPARCVVSGPREAVQRLKNVLSEREIVAQELHTSHAFHSKMIEPMLGPFAEHVKKVRLKPPKVPYISNLTGTWITTAQTTDPLYWIEHTRQTVRFVDGMNTLLQKTSGIFLEVGPGQTLSTLSKLHPARTDDYIIIASFQQRHQAADLASVLQALGQLWLAGVSVDWEAFSAGEERRRLPLPTYPFERKRYWIEPLKTEIKPAINENGHQENQASQVVLIQTNETFPAQTQGKDVPVDNATTQVVSGRRMRIQAALKDLFAHLLGIEADKLESEATFLEMGADSLHLLQASQIIRDRFKVKLPFRQLLEEHATIDLLSAYIEREQVEDWPTTSQLVVLPSSSASASQPEQTQAQSAPQPAFNPYSTSEPLPESQNGNLRQENVQPAPTSELERIMTQQLQIISQQLNILQNSHGAKVSPPLPPHLPDEPQRAPYPSQEQQTQISFTSQAAQPEPTPSQQVDPETFVPYRPRVKDTSRGLNAHQQKHLDGWIEHFTQRTRGSKRLAQTYRPYLADSRASSGFSMLLKELVYPIVIHHAAEARVWDVDGNEYVDIAMGFGSLLFGHSPSFIRETLEEQIKKGIRIGLQSDMVGETARLICELTNVERVTFCNSGTEAVMTSLRLARTVTGRPKIAVFAGSFHGTFDGVLVTAHETKDKQLQTMPLAPGIPPHMIEDVMILYFDRPGTIDILQAHAHELAAVLVELPQSRRPDLLPTAMLQQLRKFTREAGIALIFDEVVSGFRIHPGGAQALFGVQADLVTYGKAIGGGLPFGVVAGKAEYMDALDGGMWNYGDESYPGANVTFFAGTYFKHPLLIPILHAILTHLKGSGPALQQRLDQRTSALVERLNSYFTQERVPIYATHFSSLFRFVFPPELKQIDANLFYYHLLANGVYVPETRSCFLSTAHTDADIEHIVRAVKNAVAALREGGFLAGELSHPAIQTNQQDTASKLNTDQTLLEKIPSSLSTSLREGNSQETGAIQILPLTEAQKGLWFLSQMGENASRSYNQSMALHLRGLFRREAMQAAIQELVERHEALRTTIIAEGDCQQIIPASLMEVPFIDFSGTLASEREARLSDWLAKEAQWSFRLETGPLIRIHIVRLAEDHHLLVLTLHHIIADGWSVGLLLKELSELYSAACQGIPHRLPAPVKFSEYVQKQTELKNSKEMAAAETYWLAQFAGSISPLELPLDRPRPAIQTYAAATQHMLIEGSLSKALSQLSAQQNCSLFTTLFAAFNLLLSRLSGQKDVVVAIPAVGQLFTGSPQLVGYCVNLLPVHTHLVREHAFTEYLAYQREHLLDAQEHHIYPFVRLVEKLNLPRDPSRMPLISASFNLDRGGELQFFDLEVQTTINPSHASQYDIVLNITQLEAGLELEWMYNTNLFDDMTIKRWLGHYRTVLESIVIAPQQRISDVPLLTAIEEHELLTVRNHTFMNIPLEQCFHSLFEAQAIKAPDAVAVEFMHERITYQELNRRANQLARYLRLQGVGAEVRVGICMERSLEMLIGLLGIFKVGGAFVPLDVGFPRERMAFMLTDSQAILLLTQQRLVEYLPDPDDTSSKFLCLDSEWELIEQSSDDPVKSGTTGNDLAYIMYTSGSTGKPKGVLIPHSGLVNYLVWCSEAYGTAHGRGAPVQSSIAADAIFPSLFSPLLVGTSVVLLPESRALESLSEALQMQGGFSMMKITPTQLEVLNQQLPPVDATGWVRTLVAGAEALRGDILDFWQLHTHDNILLNEYGPTETVVGCSIYHVPAGQLISGPVPIGLPIANTQFYVLDSSLQLVPIGVTGELYIGGAGVAWGYLNRPEQTAQAFIPDPFSNEAGARLYKTGDLVRYLPESASNIEFLGRIDHQVKIRGYRVELGEIEAILVEHPMVEQTVVTVREDISGAKQLAAYVVPVQGMQPSIAELYGFLQQKLPDYSVPSSLMLLDALPLTATGKVDLRALSAPDRASRRLDQSLVAPRTPTEYFLAEVWSQVLGLEQVGIYDNFFASGGHSLLATQVVARIRKHFQINLPLHQFFRIPTISSMAEYIENAVQEQQHDTDTFSMLLEKVRRLSDDDARNMLAELRDSE